MKNLFTTLISFTKKLKRLDYVIILIFFAIFASLIFFRITKKTEWVTVGVQVANNEWWWQDEESTSYWLSRDLAIGSIAKDSFGEDVAEVLDKQTFEDGIGRKAIFVVMKIKTHVDEKRNLYLYNSRPIEIGKSIDITFGNHNVEGVIAFFGKDIFSEQLDAKATIRFEWTEGYVADKLEKSMKMTDDGGRVLIDVLDIRKELYEFWPFSDIRGRTVPAYDPKSRSVEVDINLKVYRDGNAYYYLNGTRMNVGNDFLLILDNFSMGGGKVTKFEVL